MLVGAAAIPGAPLLTPGVVPRVPDLVTSLARAAWGAVAALPDADTALLVTAGGSAIYDRAEVGLASLGLPSLTRTFATDQAAMSTLARVTQLPRQRTVPLPAGLACLALHTDGRWPLVPVTVSPRSGWDVLVALGAGLVQAVEQLGRRTVLVVAADGSAGLTARAPRSLVPGAGEWQERLVAALAGGDTTALEDLGPREAARVHALGWAPLAVLHGATRRAGLPLELVTHGAPRGVGYVVARTS